MTVPDHVRRLRDKVGNDLLVLPSVTVLPRDDAGRVLLVRHTYTGQWGLIGGAVEADEAPDVAARRETLEEAGVEVELSEPIAALGGPEFRLQYPNGDQVSYVSVVYDARVLAGDPAPDGDETDGCAWFAIDRLASSDINDFARATFAALGWI